MRQKVRVRETWIVSGAEAKAVYQTGAEESMVQVVVGHRRLGREDLGGRGKGRDEAHACLECGRQKVEGPPSY